MENNKQSNTKAPTHRLIQNNIVNDIIRGIYEIGSMIPNQEFFSKKYGVSRTTVRKATDELIRNGILVSVKGKGTFVCDYGKNIHQIFGSTSFDEAVKIRDRLKSRTVAIRETEGTEAVCKRLHISNGGKVVYIERIRLLNGNPYAFQMSYLNCKYVKNINFTADYLDNGSLFKLLEDEAGLVPAYQDEEIRAVSCPDRIAGFLGAEINAPMVMIFRTVYTSDGRVMEYCEDYENTDYKSIYIRTFARRAYGEDDCR